MAMLTDETKDLLPMFFCELDDLRDSGVTNMFGAAEYLDLPKREGRIVLGLWMKTYDPDKCPSERALRALGKE